MIKNIILFFAIFIVTLRIFPEKMKGEIVLRGKITKCEIVPLKNNYSFGVNYCLKDIKNLTENSHLVIGVDAQWEAVIEDIKILENGSGISFPDKMIFHIHSPIDTFYSSQPIDKIFILILKYELLNADEISFYYINTVLGY